LQPGGKLAQLDAGIEDNEPFREGTDPPGLCALQAPPRSSVLSSDRKQILKDLPRTFNNRVEVVRHADIIESVLIEYAAADPEVGYCQGMNCVAAVVSSQFPNQSEAFGRFQAVVADIRGLWLPGFPLYLLGMSAFEVMYREQLPKLHSHFLMQCITFDMFLPDTWLTLFSRWLPFVILWEAFELIEAEGFPSVLCITAALLQMHSAALAETEDFTSLFVLLKALNNQPYQPQGHELIAVARGLLPAAKKALASVEEQNLVRKSSLSHLTCGSVTREGEKVIHELSGLEILNEETLNDTTSFAHAMHAANTIRLAKGTTGMASGADSGPSKAPRQRRGGCCLPCGAGKRCVDPRVS